MTEYNPSLLGNACLRAQQAPTVLAARLYAICVTGGYQLCTLTIPWLKDSG